MYRVVLIDDENIIVEGLRRVIKWADYGCEVVGTASGAEEGAALIRKLQPHILFTDIRMPGADGLTMLAAVDRLLEAAGRFPGVVLFVTNEVGDGIVPDNALAREYRDLAGLVNQKAAQAATEVYWVVCGLPVEIKRQALAILEGTV